MGHPFFVCGGAKWCHCGVSAIISVMIRTQYSHKTKASLLRSERKPLILVE